jgi:hypothetical protein
MLIGFFSNNSYCQTLIDVKKVPEAITKKFTKKYKTPQETKWFVIDPQKDYLVKFLNNGLDAEIKYDKLGKEIASKMQIEISKLNTKIADDIRKNHSDKKIDKAYLIISGPTQKYYSVILHKSQSRKKPPLVYDAQYNFQGVVITVYEPTIEEEKVEEDTQDKYGEKVDKELSDLEEVEYDKSIKKDDLPSPAIDYLKERHDLIDYRFKEVRIRENKTYGEHYYVELKKQGEKKLFIYNFDIYGKMLSEEVQDL